MDGPALLIGNHVLHMDNAVYLKCIPRAVKKRLAIAAGAHMFKNYLKEKNIRYSGKWKITIGNSKDCEW